MATKRQKAAHVFLVEQETCRWFLRQRSRAWFFRWALREMALMRQTIFNILGFDTLQRRNTLPITTILRT